MQGKFDLSLFDKLFDTTEESRSGSELQTEEFTPARVITQPYRGEMPPDMVEVYLHESDLKGKIYYGLQEKKDLKQMLLYALDALSVITEDKYLLAECKGFLMQNYT